MNSDKCSGCDMLCSHLYVLLAWRTSSQLPGVQSFVPAQVQRVLKKHLFGTLSKLF